MKKAKNYYCIGVILFLLFVLYTVLVSFVDIAAIGPQGSEVGLASINGPISKMLPFNSVFYNASKYLGYVGIATCVLFGIFGAMQLFFKKSLFKVDKDILFLGGFYVVMLLTYILFEKVVINYRPVIMDQGLEPSYPSSHTMLAVGFITVAIAQFKARLRNKTTRSIVIICLVIVMIAMVVTRVLSGVHWMTDIFGGILIAEAWAMIYCGIFAQIMAKKKKKKKQLQSQEKPQQSSLQDKPKPSKPKEKPQQSKSQDKHKHSKQESVKPQTPKSDTDKQQKEKPKKKEIDLLIP